MPKPFYLPLFCWPLLAFLFVDFNLVYGQRNLSPHLSSITQKVAAGGLKLNVSVKDTIHFKRTYRSKIGIGKIYHSSQCILVSVDNAEILRELQHDPNVLFIDIRRKPHPEGNFDLVNPSINKINQARNAYPNLQGEGFNISIKEENFIESYIDLKGRTFRTAVTSSISSQHATTMAVLVGGAGNSSSLTQGIASRARLTSSDFNNLMPDENALFITNNIRAQNQQRAPTRI
jgi:hypothetical protein